MKASLFSLLLIELLTLSFSEDLDIYYKDFMKSYGYTLEENPVTTEDGFILSLWHLKPEVPNGKVVFFQHGLADTSWCFFQLGEKSLPFLLLKEGYDVWLGNTRGNIFSSNHINKKTNDIINGFDDYTIDDFALIDLPTMVKYVKSTTGIEKMSYICHSQGSTIFIMLSMHDPSFIQSTFDHFSSIGTVPNIKYAQFGAIEFLDKIYGVAAAVKIFNTLNLSNTQRNLIAGFCKLAPGICGKIFDSGASIKPSGRMDYKNIYNFLYYYPGGTCRINLLHWSQIHTMKQLVYYNPNFDEERTAKPYNIENLKKWKVKALIARTDDDTLSSYEDVTEFYNTIEDKSNVELLDLTKYGHVDVLSADSAYEDIFIPILNFLNY